MDDLFYYKLRNFYNFINLIFFFQVFISPSPLLNNIIKLSDNNFIYNHISINSKGDMIIDTSSSTNKERKFYGLKKDGTPYFGTSAYKTISVKRNSDLGRSEGEASFIKFTKKYDNSNTGECLAFIPQKNSKYVEYYLLDENSINDFQTNLNNFQDILSPRFSILKLETDNEQDNEYIISYINNLKIGFYRGYFDFSKEKIFSLNILNSNPDVEIAKISMVSCYITKNKIYICFYLTPNSYNYLSISFSLDQKRNMPKTNKIYSIVDGSDASYENIFLKAIHIKGEIGAFIYFKKLSYKYPTVVFKISNQLFLSNYINEVNLNEHSYSFNKDAYLNDFIKINNDQICYISTNTEKNILYVVILTLYDSDNEVSTKYYVQNMNDDYNIKFYKQIITNIYNGFITIAFSHSSTTRNDYSSSFFIIGYPNSDSYIFDIINEIKIRNTTIDKLCFDLDKKINIENNLFEYSFYGTKIIDFPDEIKLKTGKTNIQKDFILLKDKCLSISFPTDEGIYKANSYTIEIAYIVKESDNGDLDSYTQKEFIGKYSNFTFVIENDIYCLDDNCLVCDNSLLCLICKENMDFKPFKEKCSTVTDEITSEFESESESKVQTDEVTEKLETTNSIYKNIIHKSTNYNYSPIITEILNFQTETLMLNTPDSTTQYKSNNCTLDDLIKNKCSNDIINDQVTDIYDKLKGQIKSNKNLTISTEKVIFQISTLEEQRSNNNPNISSIDLGKCEEKIKESRGLSEEDNLIIYKIDIKSEDLSTTYVQYEIYDPKTFEYIELDICEGIFINIYTPITLKESTDSLFQRMSNSGYDLFNLNDSFYNDICSTYTTQDGTDLTLLDRKKIIYDKNTNISMCQEGCILLNYNATLKKANCDCKVQTEDTNTNIEEINFNKKDMVSSFYKTLANSNFLVLKCYKLVFSKKGQIHNIGSLIMSIMAFIFIILFIIILVKGRDKINNFIQQLLEQKLTFGENEKNNEESNIDIFKNNIKNKNNDNNKNKNKKSKFSTNRELNKSKIKTNKTSKIKKAKKRRSKSKIKNFPPKKPKKEIGIKSSLLSSNKSMSNRNSRLSHISIILNNQNKNQNKDIFGDEEYNGKYSNLYIPTVKENGINKNKLNDEELNGLYYELAIELDKRTYFQYYISLLKKKHLILFAFCPSNDYNLPAIKISTLILAFTLYFTINGFFFSDETMNKINEDKGAFNLLYQIPQILYSTLICAVINLILKRLSLTEKQILLIKQEKTYKDAKRKSKQIKLCLKTKLIIFFVFSFLLMVFFWYFISCFCAVYKNTQAILIKDTLISFGLSMVYPFGLNLLPGIFRIPALKAKNKNMKYLYQFSGFVALI